MAAGTRSEPLSGDLTPLVAQPGVSMFVARLESVNWARKTEQGLDLEVGSAVLKVVEVLHGAKPQSGDMIEITATRLASPSARQRNRANYWNILKLNPNDILILACDPTDKPLIWNALAAQPIPSADAPDVGVVRQAYAIEALSGPLSEKLQMLQNALESDQALLNRYSLDYLQRHADSQRDSGVQLLHNAILSPKVPSSRKLDLAMILTGQPFLLRDRKADPANQIVVGTLATALVEETDPVNRSTWARLLSASVLGQFTSDPQEASRIRSTLMRSPQDPSPARVTAALSDLLAHSSGQEKEIVSRLLKAWQSGGQ
jgi:hypothetical protein